MTQKFPLQWPLGRPRSNGTKRSKFQTSFTTAIQKVKHEIKLMGGSDTIISTNVHLRLDGDPYASRKAPADLGVAVYFVIKGKQMCFACDQWDRIHDNLYAVAKTIEALRGIGRWGTGEMVQQAFSGFLALPPPRPKRDPLEVFGFTKPPKDYAEVKTRWRTLALERHPDQGGTADQMEELRAAHEELRKQFNQS